MGQSSRHPLRGLLVAQFLGSFNNNALKWFVALLAFEQVTAGQVLNRAARDAEQTKQLTTVFVIFTLPFVLISLPAGVLADRLSKRLVLIAMKAVELLTLVGISVALFLNPAGGTELLALVLLIGMAAAVFSPAMYGSLPEILPHDRLSSANGLLAMWTFLAIIAGTGPAALWSM